MTLFEMFQTKVTAGLASNDTIGFTVKNMKLAGFG